MKELPVEIWCKIFSYLDFETAQKTATLVCKSWFHMIRNDLMISGELALNSFQKMDISDINFVLSTWKNLQILRIYNKWHPNIELGWKNVFPKIDFEFNFKEIEASLSSSVKKVIIPVNIIPQNSGITVKEVDILNNMLPKWSKVSKFCFDPQSISPQLFGLTMTNISELCLNLGRIEEFNGCLESIGASMVNLESMVICIQEVSR